jgi:hypothetical protein
MLMSFVLLPIITNQKLIDSIPVFLAFTISPVSLCLRCFFFFLDCIPYTIYCWQDQHASNLMTPTQNHSCWLPSILNLQAWGPQHVTVHQSYLITWVWIKIDPQNWILDDAWCSKTPESAVPLVWNTHQLRGTVQRGRGFRGRVALDETGSWREDFLPKYEGDEGQQRFVNLLSLPSIHRFPIHW